MNFKEYILGKSAHKRVPAIGTFELTPRCNMNCRMCYIRMNEQEMAPMGRELTAEEWNRIFDEANNNGLLYLLLTGGEALLRPDFYDIYSHAYNAGAVMSVNSNGTLIGEKQVAFFESKPPEYINVTVYGPDDETYEKLCCNPNGFTQLKKAVSLLKEAKIRFYLNCSVTGLNREHLPKMIEFANGFGCDLNIASYMFPPVRKNPAFNPDKINIRLSAEECGEVFAYLNTKKEPNKVKAMLEAIAKSQPIEDDNVCPDTHVKCMAGKASFWMTWYGAMKPCAMMPDEVSMDNGFTDAWKKTVANTDAICVSAECEKCPSRAVCKTCAAINYAEEGDYSKTPRFMCKFTETYISTSKKLLSTK